MLSDTPVAVDRGGYRDTVTTWEEPAWRAEVLARVRAGFTARGLRPTGRWRVRPRPWWVLLRLDVEEHGAVWFKANPPAGAFEGGLTAALTRWVPGHVLEPLAVDTGRGWSLLPDGGPLLRDVLAREAVAPGAWEELARQSAAVPHAGDLARLGVPAVPTAALPGVLDRFEDTPPAHRERAALRKPRPRLTDWCTELDALGVPDSLDHADLHDGQVFHPAPGARQVYLRRLGRRRRRPPLLQPRRPRPPGRRRHHGPGVLPRLRDAYLEPWTDTGRTTAELRRAVSLARRLGALHRAAYGRVFPAAPGAAGAATAGGGRPLSAGTPRRTTAVATARRPAREPLSVADARLRTMDEVEFMRGRVYGADHDNPGPRAGRAYAHLVGGPLDGLLLDVTDLTAQERERGVVLATEIGRYGPGGHASYTPRPGDARRFDWRGDVP